MQGIRMKLRMSYGPEQRSIAGVLPQGSLPPHDPQPMEAEWRGEAPAVAGGKLSVEVESATRRHVAVIAATDSSWSTRYSGQAFTWNGGEPAEPIDVDDLEYDPVNPDTAFVDQTRGLTVLTDRFPEGRLTFNNSAGANVFLEGEEEADFRVWPGF